MKKMFRRPDFVLKQTATARSLTVGVFQDYEESVLKKTFTLNLATTGTAVFGTARWNQATWGAANAGAVVEVGSNLGLARSVAMKVTGPTGLSWGMDSFTIKYNPRKVKA
jgi:hypothetical protein